MADAELDAMAKATWEATLADDKGRVKPWEDLNPDQQDGWREWSEVARAALGLGGGRTAVSGDPIDGKVFADGLGKAMKRSTDAAEQAGFERGVQQAEHRLRERITSLEVQVQKAEERGVQEERARWIVTPLYEAGVQAERARAKALALEMADVYGSYSETMDDDAEAAAEALGGWTVLNEYVTKLEATDGN